MVEEEVWGGPLFVVGASRSGTAMLRAMLNRHSLVKLAGETHYFDDLRRRLGNPSQRPLSDEECEICSNYFRALDDRPYGMHGDPAKSEIKSEEFVRIARETGNGSDSFFEAYCRLVAKREDKPIWGEKTPRHVFCLKDVFERYPTAKVICMVRDPRAVVASYRDWKNQGGLDTEGNQEFLEAVKSEEQRAGASYNIVIATTLWKATVNAMQAAQRATGADRVVIQRYEDVVLDPESSIRELCGWIGIEYEPHMLSVPMQNSSISAFSEEAGISSAPLERWRKTLSEHEIGVVQKVSGESLNNVGYKSVSVDVGLVSYLMEWAKVPFAFVGAAMVNKKRIAGIFPYVARRLRFALGAKRTW